MFDQQADIELSGSGRLNLDQPGVMTDMAKAPHQVTHRVLLDEAVFHLLSSAEYAAAFLGRLALRHEPEFKA